MHKLMNYQTSNYWTIKHFELKMSAQLVTQNEYLGSYARILQKIINSFCAFVCHICSKIAV